MLDIILVAAAMYVCPGDVYTDAPRPGCRPLQESGREGFSTIPEAPEFDSKSSVSTGEGGKVAKDEQHPVSGRFTRRMREVRRMGQTFYEIEQHRSTRSFTVRVRTMDQSQAGLWQQSASQLPVTIPSSVDRSSSVLEWG